MGEVSHLRFATRAARDTRGIWICYGRLSVIERARAKPGEPVTMRDRPVASAPSGQGATCDLEGLLSSELDCRALVPSDYRWRILHTRARCEKVVAAALEKRSISHYLPLIQSRRTYGKRVLSFTKPLFPGYLFMYGNTRASYVACDTRRIANMLDVADQDGFRWELAQIYRVVKSGESVDLYPHLRDGARCRITTGSLRGIEGVVIRRRGKSRMYITATVLGQSAVIEVDCTMLEAAD